MWGRWTSTRNQNVTDDDGLLQYISKRCKVVLRVNDDGEIVDVIISDGTNERGSVIEHGVQLVTRSKTYEETIKNDNVPSTNDARDDRLTTIGEVDENKTNALLAILKERFDIHRIITHDVPRRFVDNSAYHRFPKHTAYFLKNETLGPLPANLDCYFGMTLVQIKTDAGKYNISDAYFKDNLSELKKTLTEGHSSGDVGIVSPRSTEILRYLRATYCDGKSYDDAMGLAYTDVFTTGARKNEWKPKLRDDGRISICKSDDQNFYMIVKDGLPRWTCEQLIAIIDETKEKKNWKAWVRSDEIKNAINLSQARRFRLLKIAAEILKVEISEHYIVHAMSGCLQETTIGTESFICYTNNFQLSTRWTNGSMMNGKVCLVSDGKEGFWLAETSHNSNSEIGSIFPMTIDALDAETFKSKARLYGERTWTKIQHLSSIVTI